MTAEQIAILLGAIGSLLTIMGGGAAWLLNRVDTKARESELQESQARGALSERLMVEITTLRLELSELQKEKALYLRRIYQLESLIHLQDGLALPPMEGWPPV